MERLRDLCVQGEIECREALVDIAEVLDAVTPLMLDPLMVLYHARALII